MPIVFDDGHGHSMTCYSPQDWADRYNVSRKTVYAWMDQGLDNFRERGRRWIPALEGRAWISHNTYQVKKPKRPSR